MTKKNRGKARKGFLGQDRQQPLNRVICGTKFSCD